MQDKVYVPWPVAMEIADKLDAKGLTKLAREIRGIVWNEAARLYMLERSGVDEVKPLYIYLGSRDGYGMMMDHKPSYNQYHWYELGPAVSDDPKHNDEHPIDWYSTRHNPRRLRSE